MTSIPWAACAAITISWLGVLQLLLGLVGQRTGNKAFSFTTVGGMRGMGFERGRPLLSHGGTIATILLLPWCVYTVIEAAERTRVWWTPGQTTIAANIAFLLTVGMHYLYLAAEAPEGHIINKSFTLPMFPQFLAMWAAMTLFILYFAWRPDLATREEMIWMAIALTVFLLMGTHLALDIVATKALVFFARWYPGGNPWQNVQGWGVVLIGGAVTLVRAVTFRRA